MSGGHQSRPGATGGADPRGADEPASHAGATQQEDRRWAADRARMILRKEASAGAPAMGAADSHAAERVYLAPDRTDHSQQRKDQGRRTGPAFNDAQRARQSDLFVQDDGRWVLRGGAGREHIFLPNGDHLTTMDRSNAAHLQKVRNGDRRPASGDEFARFQGFYK